MLLLTDTPENPADHQAAKYVLSKGFGLYPHEPSLLLAWAFAYTMDTNVFERNEYHAFLCMKEAVEILEKNHLDNKNLAFAYCMLAKLSMRGIPDVIEKSLYKAQKLIERALKVDPKSSSAHALAADIFFTGGDGIEKDDVKAEDYYKLALRLSYENSHAWGRLGYLYLYGGIGVAKNVKEAKRCFEEALKYNALDPFATAHLADLLLLGGDGVEKDEARARTLRASLHPIY